MAHETPGRPAPEISEELTKQIESSIRSGNYIKTACLAAGVAPRTFYNWQKAGEEGREPYATFWHRCARARAQHEQDLVALAQSGDEKGVSYGPSKAATWMLERTRPQQFSQRLNVTLEKELDTILKTAERVLDAGQFEKLVQALCASEASGEETSEDSEQ